MRNLLFQGDSITDSHRNRSQIDRHLSSALGDGYVNRIASELYLSHPDCHVVNRGVAGDCIQDMINRWEQDCILLKPNVLTVLIGINDTWHQRTSGKGDDPKTYLHKLDKLLTNTQSQFPDLTICLMEIFFFPISAADSNWQPEVSEKQMGLKDLAKSKNWHFLPLQQMLNRAAEPKALLFDGVHPTPGAHSLIAKEWLAWWHKLNIT